MTAQAITRTNVATPPPGASSTTLQVGTYNALTDTWTLVQDLNDGATFLLKPFTLKLPPAKKVKVSSSNVRTAGERVVSWQYGNRQVTATFSVRGATYAALQASYAAFVAAVDRPPYRLRIALPGAANYTYADVVYCEWVPDADPIHIRNGVLLNCTVAFECAPGLPGDRLTYDNLVPNPGFEAPMGGGLAQSAPVAFADPLANVSAYTVVAGSAPTTGPSNTYVDMVLANGGASLLRYYRLDEASGTSAFDIAGSGQTGTTHGSPTQGVAGLLTGDTDTCYTFASASSQFITAPGTGLPTGNSAFSYAVWFKFASNPASNSTLFYYGGTASKSGSSLWIDSSGKLNCDVLLGTGQITSASAVTTATSHLAVVTWDGTTLTLYLDGTSVGTPTTPGTLSLVTTNYIIGDNNTTAYYSGQLDEQKFYGAALTSTQVGNLYTAGHTGPSGTLANAMTLPQNATVSFGSPAWGAIQTWQVRFRYTTSLVFKLFPHRTDGNNYLLAQIFNGVNGLGLFHDVAGTLHTLAQATPGATLAFEAYYWLQVTQFPAVAGSPPYVQVTLLSDTDGAVGSQLAQIAAATFDGVTALSGVAALSATGAAAVIGGQGNSAGAGQQVSLFGPGGWIGSPAAGTVPAACAWEQSTANTATLGATNSGNLGLVQVPVTSYGAARIDAPPTGAWTGVWQSGNPASLATLQQSALPVAAGGDTLAISGMVKATGNGSGYRVYAQINEYTAAGAFVTSNQNTIASGAGAVPWQAWNWSYTTQATTAFVVLILVAIDGTSSSAGSTTWFDNVLVWDKTAAAQNGMPYCELRFPTNPAQIIISGIQGDLAAPTAVEVGFYFPANWPLSSTALAYVLGMRGVPTKNMSLVQTFQQNGSPILDATSYGGYYRTPAGGATTFFSFLGPVTAESDQQGIYHLWTRFYTGQSSGNLKNVTLQAELAQYTPATFTGTQTLALPDTTVAPLTTAAGWNLVDGGQFSVPPTGAGALTDLTQLGVQFQQNWADSTGGGSIMRANCQALLPVDSDLLLGTVINAIGDTLTNQWLWLYVDGLAVQQSGGAAALSSSIESTSLPNPGHGNGGPGTGSSNYFVLNGAANPLLNLYPGIPGASAMQGVNEGVLIFMDNNGLPTGCATELRYSPLYLYPRA